MALSGALAPPVFVLSAVIATLATPGYSSVGATFSELAGPGAPPWSWVISAGFVGYGLLVQPLGPLLHAVTGRGWLARALWGLVVVYGAGGVLAGVFRDAHRDRVLWGVLEDTVHDVAARAAFASILLLTFVVPWALRGQPSWRAWRRFSLVVGVLSAMLVLAFQLEAWPEGRGLLQRSFFLTTMAWVGATALWLYRLGSRPAS